MTARGFYTLFFGVLLLAVALSLGSAGAFLLGSTALVAWILSLLCTLSAWLTCRTEQELPDTDIERGDVCTCRLHIRLFSLLPIAPLTLTLSLPNGRQSEYLLHARFFGHTASENTFPCPHVGPCSVGLTRIGFSDCFGLFVLNRKIRTPLQTFAVIPRPAKTAPVSYSPGEGETTAAQRAQADLSTPADTRTWQDGDELRRVHWKLSMRKRELVVRTYETPQRPDALILLNCTLPNVFGAQRSTLIDAMTETCAGVLDSLLKANRLARLPLSGGVEVSGRTPAALPAMLHALALEPFDRQRSFSKELWLASRRMRRTGSVVILSGEVTPAIADAAIALSRMGARTRFTLITTGEMNDTQRKLMHLMMLNHLETTHMRAVAHTDGREPYPIL